MGRTHNYLELHRRLRAILFCICFLLASISLYMGIGSYFFLPGGTHRRFPHWLFPLFYVLLAVVIDFVTAWLIQQQRQRSFLSTFAIIFAATVVGAILVSMAVMRGNWVEFVKESLGLS
jgi:cytochrome bd-type quinol oxidase subunit 2